MQEHVTKSNDFARIQRLVQYITDNFHMTCLQNRRKPCQLVEAKAQVCVER